VSAAVAREEVAIVRATKVLDLAVRADGIAVVTVNDPREPVNTVTRELAEELSETLERVEADKAIKGVVIASAKKDFVVGANIDMLKAVKLASDAEAMARGMAELLGRVASLKKPFVAAVDGAALGGGLELALACDAIVASDEPGTGVGLPEVNLGLLPAANGMLRLVDRAGLQVTLDLALTGRRVPAKRAKKLGVVDEVCPAAILVEVACARALDLARHADGAQGKKPAGLAKHLRESDLAAAALEDNALGRAILFKKAREETKKKTRGHYPAAERILDVLERYGSGGEKRFAKAAALEAKAFGELVVSETAHRLIELFFATTALKKDPGVDDGAIGRRAESTPAFSPSESIARDVTRVGVLGGGLMGGGIAYVTTDAGIPVRLKDKDDAGVGRGLKYVRGIFDERLKRRRIAREELDQRFSLLTGTTDYSGLKHADVVIEAVFEDLALKQEVVRQVEAVTSAECIFASNTSSIPIASIAEASRHPETVIGMHYFSPVHKMPLLEVIRTDRTAPWAVATAVALGKKQGKHVIVVKDGVGFYTSRSLAPYMNEAAHLVAEGVAIEAIDRAMVDWGFPVGPLQLLDEVGIDVGAHVAEIVHAAFGDRMLPPSGMRKLLEDDRRGRKNARGFYRYDAKGSKKDAPREVDASVYAALGVTPKTKLPAEEIQMRCALQMVNEALLCLGERILRTPRDGDVGAVFGLGFPPFRGGPFRYVDTLGAAEILRRMRGYEMRFGRRFAPASVLVDMARKGDRFYPG
jgi:3-hydroxyacyl-CoA dehydrogenase/enoyl-CoA hydratase/3-hydroxybutyryl-CoA epimerase